MQSGSFSQLRLLQLPHGRKQYLQVIEVDPFLADRLAASPGRWWPFLGPLPGPEQVVRVDCAGVLGVAQD